MKFIDISTALQAHDSLQHLSFNQVVSLVHRAALLKDDIQRSNISVDTAPEVLPPSVADFLAISVDISSRDMDVLWDIIRDVVWDLPTMSQRHAEEDALFVLHGHTRGITKYDLYPPCKRCTNPRYAFECIPFEIWYDIFQYVIPPSTFLDSSLSCGPRSPWSLALRTKKTLVSVCKTWYNVGIHLLYRQIVLRRFPQIYFLLQSLDLNSDLGPMIKDITVSCFVLCDDSPLVKSELNRLLNYCPLVSHFTFAIEPQSQSELYSPSDFLAAATHMLSNVTHLEFGPKALFSDVVPHLTHCKSLISLTFDMHGQTSNDMATEAVDLPTLEALRISWQSDRLEEIAVLGVITSWSMPRLYRFTIHQMGFFRGTAERYYFPFLKKYGPALSTLCVAVWFPDVIPMTHFVQALLEFCPNLEHLAISSFVLIEKLSHKTLKWIDIWATTPERHLMKAQDFPMLRGVRTLDWTLLTTAGPALHLHVPPNMVEGGESKEWVFPGVHVRHDPGHLYRRDLDYLPGYISAVEPISDWESGDEYDTSDSSSYTDYSFPDTEDSLFRQ